MNVRRFLKSRNRTVFTVKPDDSVTEMSRGFGEQTGGEKLSVAVVCDSNGRVVGVVSMSDIVRAVAKYGERIASLFVRDIMTRDVVTAHPLEDVRELLKVMAERNIRHTPVVEEDQLIGLVARRDALEFLYDQDELELEQLRGYVFRSGARY